jgi:hypothetical protein
MRRAMLGVAVAAGVLVRPAPARADSSSWDDVTIAVAAIGVGYAAQTAVFAIEDASNPHHGFGVGALEAGINLPVSSVLTWTTLVAVRDNDYALGFVSAGLSLLADTLAYDGMRSVADHWPYPVASWQLGLAAVDSLQLMGFAMYDVDTDGDHDSHEAMGIVETAVNGPTAIALAALSAREAFDHHRGPAIVLGGGAVVSGLATWAGIELMSRTHGGSAASPPVQPIALPAPMLLEGARGQPALGLGVSGSL